MTIADLSVNRWRRFGHDRLYVERPDGERLGWWDLAEQQAHPETPEHAAELLAAVAAWTSGSIPAAKADETPAQVEPVPVVEREPEPDVVIEPEAVGAEAAVQAATVVAPELPAVPWLDLSTNAAGEAARREAEARRQAAPVRTAVARVLGVKNEERAWRIGADGEERVAAQVEKVRRKDPRWRAIHAIPVGTRGSDIDHVVIGPGGVFSINTKHHPQANVWVGGSTVRVNGSRTPYVRNSRHEAERASTLLTNALGAPVHVTPLVVVLGAATLTVKSQPDGLWVVSARQLPSWLRRLGETLPEDQVERIFEVARRSTTWR